MLINENEDLYMIKTQRCQNFAALQALLDIVRLLHVRLFVADPISSSLPEIVVWLKGFDHGLQVGVVCLILTTQQHCNMTP